MRGTNEARRWQGIDQRMCARRIAGYQARNRFARLSAGERARRMQFLDALAARPDGPGFGADECAAARAALLQRVPDGAQRALDLRRTLPRDGAPAHAPATEVR